MGIGGRVLPPSVTSSGGRSSVSGVVATVFGASGSLGRYVVERLARVGSRVVIPYRGDGMEVRHLRVLGDLGQVVPVPFELGQDESIRLAVKQSNVVINLLGRHYQTKNFPFERVHIAGAQQIASISREAGVNRFIHVSCLKADPLSRSSFLSSKGLGEQAVREIYPDATIIRPAVMFGRHDRFLNTYAKLARLFPVLPLVNGGSSKIQPVYCVDVASAILEALNYANSLGEVYELVGPDVMTYKDVVDRVCTVIQASPSKIRLPNSFAFLAGRVLQLSPWDKLLTVDQVVQMGMDAVHTVDEKTQADLGVEPTHLASVETSILEQHTKNRVFIGGDSVH